MQQMILAVLISALVGVLLAPLIIPMLRRLKFGQTERDDGPQSHLVKNGTPTIGGIIILCSILVGTLLVCLNAGSDIAHILNVDIKLIEIGDQGVGGMMEFALPALLVTFAYSLVGFLDDFIKVRRKRSLGLKAYQKIIAQFGIALILGIYAQNHPLIGTTVYLPFLGVQWDLGAFYIPFVMFVVISITNAVNLTDGLDGLASGVSMIYALTMAVIFLILSQAAAQAGQVLYGASLSGMSVFSAAVAGACLGFLRSNSYPARVFMGDTGSMALGGAIAMMAIMSRALLLLPIMGACFVASAVSVVLQVGSYKLRKKRIFKMAPLHHHFELMGMAETKIVSMYMIITAFLCLVCLLPFV